MRGKVSAAAERDAITRFGNSAMIRGRNGNERNCWEAFGEFGRADVHSKRVNESQDGVEGGMFVTLAGMAAMQKSSGNGGRMGAAVGAATAAGAGVITSRDNKWLKQFRMALRGGLATEKGAVGVEGVRLVEEALRSTAAVEAVLFSETGERHRERLAPLIGREELSFPVLQTTDRLFEGIAIRTIRKEWRRWCGQEPWQSRIYG